MDDSLTVRISSLEHFLYCPRQCALIDVEGQWLDNQFTVRGQREHRRADSGRRNHQGTRTVLRSLPLWSECWNLTGRADIVEVEGVSVWPVEYKSGVAHGRSAEVQLCAQAMCLEEMFDTSIPTGYLWYSGSRRRVGITLDQPLREITLSAIRSVREMVASGRTPPPCSDQRCDHCQLWARCLPTISSDPEKARDLIQALLAARP